uniref:hypothetical protein n=1 Tax=Candidatus Electronema sp. TaxID=2698783 RepID=UPI004057441F
MLSIEEERRLVATTVQVAIGVTAAVMWMIEHPREGVRVPDDLPHEQILRVAKPYLANSSPFPRTGLPLSTTRSFSRKTPAAI